MAVEIERSQLRKALLSGGLSEQEVREVEADFSRNNYTIDDEALLEKLMGFGKDMFTVITIMDRLGVGKTNAVRMIERRQRHKLGALVNIYTLEVYDQ